MLDMEKIKNIPRCIDISAVRTDVTLDELDTVIALAKKYRFICVFAMPCFTHYLVKALKTEEDIMVGGVVGFPSGADTTSAKVATAKEMLKLGCNELDMVINVGALKSGQYDFVKEDIKAVVEAANDTPVKSIIEVCYLNNYEIAKASELAVSAGVTFVKTGTGWGNKPTTVETIKLIKATIGDSAKIKAAGGVRDLQTIMDMMDAGCERFGIGIKSALSIIEEINAVTGNKSASSYTFASKTDTY